MRRRQTLSLVGVLVAGCMDPSTTTGRSYFITAEERSLPEGESMTRVSPAPEPVQEAIDEARRSTTKDGSTVTTTREKFESSIEPFCACDGSELSPEGRQTEYVYYLRQTERVYQIRFAIHGEG